MLLNKNKTIITCLTACIVFLANASCKNDGYDIESKLGKITSDVDEEVFFRSGELKRFSWEPLDSEMKRLDLDSVTLFEDVKFLYIYVGSKKIKYEVRDGKNLTLLMGE